MKLKNTSHTVEVFTNKLDQFLGNLNRIRAVYWGVTLGPGQRFFGKCFFRKYPGTSIVIGKKCSFRSRANSNLIGINRPCMISTLHSPFAASIEIGDGCGFSGTVIGAFKSIRIGNNVRCGANTLITDGDWHLDDPRSGRPRDVVIGDNVWLGVNSVIMKGVNIGENTVIGANSVVTKNIPANVIAAGNPCKVIRDL